MEKYIRIEKENATFQEFLALRDNRTKRTQKKKFFVEGVQSIKDALNNHWIIDCFIFSKYEDLSTWAKEILSNINCKKYEISDALMDKLSNKNIKSEILAIINKKESSKITKTTNKPLFLLVDRPSKKENFGNIIRSADAFGVDKIFYTGHSVDIFDPIVIRTSMGSFFKMEFIHLDSNQDIIDLKNNLKEMYPNIQFIATSLQSKNDISQINFDIPTVIMIGNEADDLNKFLNEIADVSAKIKMRSGIDSLNIASATAIFLYTASLKRLK